MSVYDASNAQTGDHTIGNVAGNDVHINDPAVWLDFFKSQLWDMHQARTRRDDEIAHELNQTIEAMGRLQTQFTAYQRFAADRIEVLAARGRTDRLIAVVAAVVAGAALLIGILV